MYVIENEWYKYATDNTLSYQHESQSGISATEDHINLHVSNLHNKTSNSKSMIE